MTTLTPESFRTAHPELASRAWIEGADDEDQFICWPNRLTGKVERIQLYVELCDCCEQVECECDQLTVCQGDPMNRRAA